MEAAWNSFARLGMVAFLPCWKVPGEEVGDALGEKRRKVEF
jgi:hypothetical protein